MNEADAAAVPVRQIRALHDADSVTVYQAYGPAIAEHALAHGRLGGPAFSRSRMTWIKPSFLWMMHRSDWARAAGQQYVLAVRISRTGFEAALAEAVASAYAPRLHASHDAWRRDLRRSDVRVQFDPERDAHLRALPHRTLQLGLSGQAVADYVDDWTLSVTDATPLARRLHALPAAERAPHLPPERPYPLPAPLAARLGLTGPAL